MLTRIREHRKIWDFIIIGGGATGIGCAVDAASRGFDVLLLEQSDFGKGTSSRSTKLIHGGIRYLAQGNISLVREALREREILFKNAPHLVHKQAFVIPVYSYWDKFFYGTGLKTYNLLSGKNGFGKSRILSKKETIKRLPNIKKENLEGGIIYYDGQFDDTRLLINLAQTAAGNGATLLNYARVFAFNRDENGKIDGTAVSDEINRSDFSRQSENRDQCDRRILRCASANVGPPSRKNHRAESGRSSRFQQKISADRQRPDDSENFGRTGFICNSVARSHRHRDDRHAG